MLESCGEVYLKLPCHSISESFENALLNCVCGVYHQKLILFAWYPDVQLKLITFVIIVW